MIIVALLHDKTLVGIDHDQRRLSHWPTKNYPIPESYADINKIEIDSYLYENTYRYDKTILFEFEV